MSSALGSGWYVVAQSEEVKTNKPFQAAVESSRFVIVRDQKAQLWAYLDLCPHRGSRLSGGTYHNGLLICPYHGAEFDASGACTKYPPSSQNRMPTGFVLKSFPVHEADGLIWLNTQQTKLNVAIPSSNFSAPEGHGLRVTNGFTLWNSEYSVVTLASLDPEIMMRRLRENSQIRQLFERVAGGIVSVEAHVQLPSIVTMTMSAGSMKLVCFMSHCPSEAGATVTRYACARNFMTAGFERVAADLIADQAISLALRDLKVVLRYNAHDATCAEDLNSHDLNAEQKRYIQLRATETKMA